MTARTAISVPLRAAASAGRCAALLALVATQLGCGDDTTTVLLPSDEALVLERFELTENPRNVLSFFADWVTNIPANTSLVFDCGPGETGILESDVLTRSHHVFAMGFLQDAACDVVATSLSEDGQEARASATYEVGSLSEASFPAAKVRLTQPERLQPGWTLFNLSNPFDRLVMRAVMVDALGRWRWYYRSPFNAAGTDNDIRTAPQGVLVGGVGRMLPQLITWQGEVVWEGTQLMHHDIRLWPDEEHVTFLGRGATGCNEQNVSGRVVRQSIATDEILWEWALCEHYDPPSDARDWEHSNTVEPVPDANAFLLSARNQNAIFRVDLDSEEIEWALGFSARPEEGFRGDFAMIEEDRFYRQHAPEYQDNGNILLFDNGLVGWREESRAIEIAMDFEAMRAEVVWEYRHDPPLFTDIWGDADRLPNGNRLITFGIRDPDQGSVLVEAAPEVDSRPLWVLELPGKWGIYRAERVVDIPRGYVIDGVE